jgi:hypothetical protein
MGNGPASAQDDFERKDPFERRILGERGHRAQLYELRDENGNPVGRIRDAVNAASDHVYASEVIHLRRAKPNTTFDYQIHAYFGPNARNCTGDPLVQPGGSFTTDQNGTGHHRIVVGEPGNPNSKNPIPIPPQVTGAVIGFRYWVIAQDGSARYSTDCKLVYEPTPGGPRGGPGFE